ncbi:MAG: hypothetical protein Q4Q17_00725 [Tissierellia bacterium]|nr:hypothetical protein [Tissierellia bacterium]
MLRKLMPIVLLLALLNCIWVMALNHVFGSFLYDTPYYLEYDYITLRKGKDSEKDIGLDFLNQYEDLTVIGETDKNQEIGVYDPTFRYYAKATKLIVRTVLRYFSEEDYREKKNVSILITSIDQIMNSGNSLEYIDALRRWKESVYTTEIIHMLDIHSDIGRGMNHELVRNFFSIPAEDIRTIYLQSPNGQSAKEARDRLKGLGYVETKRENRNSFVDATHFAFTEATLYTQIIYSCALFLSPLILYVLAMYIIGYYEYLHTYRMFGATMGHIWKLYLWPLLAVGVMASLISSALMVLFLGCTVGHYITLIIYGKLQVFLLLGYSLVVICATHGMYLRSKARME